MSTQDHTPFTCIIVGAGYSGLSAARALLLGGIPKDKILVLEARDRVGGRAYSPEYLGKPVDVGAGYLGPTQDRLLRMCKTYGVENYKVYDEGQNVLVGVDGRSVKRFVGSMPPIGVFGLLDSNAMMCRMNDDAATIDVSAPWLCKRAAEWDSITLTEWGRQLAWTEEAKALLEIMASNVTGASGDQISYLYWLKLVASAGRPGFPGTVNRLIDIRKSAQERKMKGGADLVCKKIAAELGPSVLLLNSAVNRIDRSNASSCDPEDATTNTIHCTNGKSYRTLRVIIALAPMIYNKTIKFLPELPGDKISLGMYLPLSTDMKTVVYYKRPWWKEKKLSGQAICPAGGPVTFSMDDSKGGDLHAIMGFVNGKHQPAFLRLTPEERKAMILDQYARVFESKEALDAIGYIEYSWVDKPYSWGCVGIMAPSALTQYGRAIAEPVGSLHFAGAETGRYWTGYLEGAIEAGERAAREVVTYLSLQKDPAAKLLKVSNMPKEVEPPSIDVPPCHRGPKLFEKRLLPSVGTALSLTAAAALIIGAKL